VRDTRGLRQVIRTYEGRLQELEHERNEQSLARTSEITRRLESEKKAMHLIDSLEETKAQLVSAQLDSERWRKQARGVVEAMASTSSLSAPCATCSTKGESERENALASKENRAMNVSTDEGLSNDVSTDVDGGVGVTKHNSVDGEVNTTAGLVDEGNSVFADGPSGFGDDENSDDRCKQQ
jgi:seryl-tRNA synthetase